MPPHPKKIILASKSPRRQELLEKMGLEFSVRVVEVDESFPSHLSPVEAAAFIAESKAKAYSPAIDEIIVTADTIVVLEGQILGKPKNRSHAAEMLRTLAGKTHRVLTGVCIATANDCITFVDETEVTFRQVTDQEIDYYIDKFLPYDKAGSYGVQDWWGLAVVEKINGSYTNVMGLPTEKLNHYLQKVSSAESS